MYIKNKGWLSQVEIQKLKRSLGTREINERENLTVIDGILFPEGMQLELEVEEEGITTDGGCVMGQVKEKLEYPER